MRDYATQGFLTRKDRDEFIIEQLFNCALSDLRRIEELQGNTELAWAKTRERLEMAYMQKPWVNTRPARKNACKGNLAPSTASCKHEHCTGLGCDDCGMDLS